VISSEHRRSTDKARPDPMAPGANQGDLQNADDHRRTGCIRNGQNVGSDGSSPPTALESRDVLNRCEDRIDRCRLLQDGGEQRLTLTFIELGVARKASRRGVGLSSDGIHVRFMNARASSTNCDASSRRSASCLVENRTGIVMLLSPSTHTLRESSED
jgi:hypothetical protein